MKDNLIKKYGILVEINDLKNNLADFLGVQPETVSIEKIVKASKDEKIECTSDDKFIYLRNEYEFRKLKANLQNRYWLIKVARHRTYEDCKGCKYFDETDKHMGKNWCEKWDTDAYNINTPYAIDNHKTNSACVPFRYFGYAPNYPMLQTQFHTTTAGLTKGAEYISKFASAYNLDEVGMFIDENNFKGAFDEGSNFEVKYIQADNKLYLNVVHGKQMFETVYPASISGFNNLLADWKNIFEMGKVADNFLGNTPRQEESYDWTNPEEYKKRHLTQKTKTFDQSPSNVDGEKFAPHDLVGENDKDLSSF